MTLKSSWMVMAVMILSQSTVLSVPVNQNLSMDPTDLLPLGNSDRSKSSGGFDPNDTSPFTAVSAIPEQLVGDMYGHFVKKSVRPTVSDADSKDPSSCDTNSDDERYPDTKPYSSKENAGLQDPTWLDDDSHNSTDQLSGNWYDKKKTKPIFDPTFTDDLYKNTTNPVKSKPNRSDSYATGNGVTTKPVGGTISDPTLSNGPSRNATTYPDDSCYCKKKTINSNDGNISDLINTSEDSKKNIVSPIDNCYDKKNSKKTRTISDAEGRPGHTATGKPCVVYSSSEHDKLPYSDKDTSYLGGKEHCILDVDQESEKNLEDSNHSYPYTSGSNGEGDNLKS